VNAGRQMLALPPGTQGAWRVSRLPLPARQGPLAGELVTPQQQDIDVTVLADRSGADKRRPIPEVPDYRFFTGKA
jgi:hypothetical protein